MTLNAGCPLFWPRYALSTSHLTIHTILWLGGEALDVGVRRGERGGGGGEGRMRTSCEKMREHPPEPRGIMATRGWRSRSRMSSRCQAAAWDSSQWPQRTVMAGWRWVKPGRRTSTSRSARSTATRMRSARFSRIACTCCISHRRVSVATCNRTSVIRAPSGMTGF